MHLQTLLAEAELDALLEAPLDMPEGSDLVQQLEILTQRLESAKRALGITNRLKDPVERKRHRARVMGFLNQLRGMFDRVTKQLWDEMQQDEEDLGVGFPSMRMAA